MYQWRVTDWAADANDLSKWRRAVYKWRVADWAASANDLSKTLACAIIAGAMSWFVWFVWDTNVSIPFSDMGAAVLRYSAFIEGRMGLVPMLFNRQVDHFHVWIFGLVALDLAHFGGSFLLPRVVGAIAAIATAYLLAAVAFTDDKIKQDARWACAAFAVAISLTGLAWEVWALSFQAVVSTFRLLFIGAMLCACLAAAKQSAVYFVACLVLAVLAMVGHGGGIMLILLLPLPFVVARQYRSAAAVAALFIPAFVLLWVSFPSAIPATIVLSTMLNHSMTLLQSATTVLGNGLYSPLTAEAWIGYIGAGLGAAVSGHIAIRWARRETIDLHDTFYLLLVLSAVIGAACAALLHLSWAIARNIPLDPMLSGASRYVPNTAGLWLGVILYTVRHVKWTRLASAGALVAAAWFLIYGGILGADRASGTVAIMREAAIAFKAGAYDQRLLDIMYPHRPTSIYIAAFMHNRHLGMNREPVILNTALQQIDIGFLHPQPALNEDGTTYMACRVSGPRISNRDVILVFRDGRVIGTGSPFGKIWLGYSRTCDVTAWQ